jgi:PAS domain S-box-containing protein
MADQDVSAATRSPWPIAWLLTALVLSILVPSVVLTSGLIWRTGHLDWTRINSQALQLARGISIDLDREIDGSIETLIALASSPSLLQGDLQSFHAQARATLQYRGLNALLRRLDGQQILNTRLPWGMPIRNQPLSDTDRQVLSTGQPAVSDLVIGAVTQSWVIGLTVPVKINEEIRYILSMSIDPAYIQKIISEVPRDPDWIVAVSDRKGRLIARSKEHEAHLGREIHPDVLSWSSGPEGVHRTPSLAGPDVVRGYKWSNKSGWITAAFVPAEFIEAPLRDLWRAFGLVAAALVGLSLPFAFFLSRHIAQPIQAAAAAATRLGRGECVAVPGSRLKEANELATALTAASRELQDRSRALTESEVRFRSVFEQSAVGIVQVGLDGRLVGVNDRLCNLLGYTREECLEKTFKVLTHPDDHAQEDDLINQLTDGRLPHYELEKRLISKSGLPTWVRVTSAMVRDGDGRALYRTSVVEDVTERRKGLEIAARLAALVVASHDAIISTSPTGDIETWNPGAEAMFGYDSKEAVGKSLAILVPPDRKSELEHKLGAAMQGQTVKKETVRLHKDGTSIDVSSTAAPIMTGTRITSVSVTMEDIRDRKRRERHIMLLNRELAHRVKNTLAVIQSIANQTLRASPEPEAFRVAFQWRLQALAAANDLLMQTNWEGTELGEFIERQLAPLMPKASMRLEKQGPHVMVPADLSVPLGLALHELGTNATKYGAWSLPSGKVKLDWALKQPAPDRPKRLMLKWSEHHGPEVVPPVHRGFGTTLIERGIPDAIVERSFQPDGIVCTIDVPLSFGNVQQPS